MVVMNDDDKRWIEQVAMYVKSGDIPLAQAQAAIHRRCHPSETREYLATLDAMVMNGHRRSLFDATDLGLLMTTDMEERWLVDDVWPEGRQVHLHAPRKTGKSLVTLWIAANLVSGREPFTGRKMEPVRIVYVDNEMTPLDLKTRLFDEMQFHADQLGGLLYLQHQVRTPLDTLEGGAQFVGWCKEQNVDAVIIDAFSRVVKGEENSNDTYRDFYMHTGEPLKAAKIALWRNDNEGHHEGRSRGASAKADDVDLVWQLKATEGGLQMVRVATRIGNVPDQVSLKMNDYPLAYSRGMRSWPVGVFDKAKELDALGISVELSVRKAQSAFVAAGGTVGKWTIFAAAVRYRRETRNDL